MTFKALFIVGLLIFSGTGDDIIVLMEQQKWRKAGKTVDAVISDLAKAPAGPDERTELSRLALYRAAIEAGRGKARDAAWYLGVAEILGGSVAEEDFFPFGPDIAQRLSSAAAGAPAPKKVDLAKIRGPSVHSGTSKTRRTGSLPSLRSICNREKGQIAIKTTVGADGRGYAPRIDPAAPISTKIRPVCVYLALEDFKGTSHPLPVGAELEIKMDLEILPIAID